MIYGPNTEAVQSIIDRIPTLTEDEIKRLGAAWSAANGAAWNAAIDAAWSAAREEAWSAAWYAACGAAWGAAGGAVLASWDAARDALLATVTYDLVLGKGPYTIAHRDLLLAPWIEVCGMPANEPGGTGHRTQGGSTPPAGTFQPT